MRTLLANTHLQEITHYRDIVPEFAQAAESFNGQITSFLSIVKDRLDQEGLRYEYLDGRTRNRADRVERFQTDPDCPIDIVANTARSQPVRCGVSTSLGFGGNDAALVITAVE